MSKNDDLSMDEEELSRSLSMSQSVTLNPIHMRNDDNPVSDAYRESLRRAQACGNLSHGYIDPRRLKEKKYGIRTKTAAAAMLLAGLVR